MRICQAPGCGEPIDHLRANAKYCDLECKRVAYEARATAGTDPSGFWAAVRRSSRPARFWTRPRTS